MHQRVASSLDSALNQSLRVHAADVAALAQQSDSGLTEARLTGVVGPQGQVAQIVGANGAVVDSTSGLARRPLIDSSALAAARHGSTVIRSARLGRRSGPAPAGDRGQRPGPEARDRGRAIHGAARSGPRQPHGRAAPRRSRRPGPRIAGRLCPHRRRVQAGGGAAPSRGDDLGHRPRQPPSARGRQRRAGPARQDAQRDARPDPRVRPARADLRLRRKPRAAKPPGGAAHRAGADGPRAAERPGSPDGDRLGDRGDGPPEAAHGRPAPAGPRRPQRLRPEDIHGERRRAASRRGEPGPASRAAPRTGIEVRSPSASVEVDAERVGQALENMLSNALRFANSRIEITAAVGEGWVEIHVLDDGPGFPPRLPFRRPGSASRAPISRAPTMAPASGCRSSGPSPSSTAARRTPRIARPAAPTSGSGCRLPPVSAPA